MEEGSVQVHSPQEHEKLKKMWLKYFTSWEHTDLVCLPEYQVIPDER